MSTEPARPLPSSLVKALLHPWTWRMAWRDSRTQRKRLVIFSLSIIAGISALVAIHALKASAQRGIEKQAKALLGSDLHISSRHPFSEEEIERLSEQAESVSREVTFSSMLYFPTADAARLVEVHGIEGDFPYYGTVETSPPGVWPMLQQKTGVLVEPALLDQFRAKVGDKVKLGSLELPILGTLLKAPARNGFGGFSPEVYLRLPDLGATGLLGATSLVTYHLHMEAADPGLAKQLKDHSVDTAWRIETPRDRRNSLGNALDNFQQFLGIIALAALVLGAIGVAGAVHAHISRRVPSIAVLRCLGCPGNLAFAVYLAQAAALGLLGALMGALIGLGLHSLAIALFRNSLPVAIDGSTPWLVIAETTLAGLAVCGGFALLPLLRVRTISPMAMLRDGAALAAAKRRGWWTGWPFYLLIAALLVVVSALDSTHWLRALSLTGSLCGAFLLLAVTSKGLAFLARKAVRPGWPYLLRQGVSNLYRPHNQTLLFLLSLGLGTFLLVTILLTKNLLMSEFSVRSFSNSPNIYLVDVQPDQVAGVTALVKAELLPVMETAPMVTMRIQSVRGVPVRELEKQHQVPKWVLQREFRSTYRDHLNPTETIVAGQWVGKVTDPDAPAPLSLEEDIAKDLHVNVGDEIVLDVQGVPITARVASLRKVDWSRFNLNFFMVFPPGVLESAPGFQVVTTRVPPGESSGDLQRVLVKQFPNVSAIDLTLILDMVQSIIGKISRVVSVLAVTTVFAGLPILIGTLLNGRDQRLRESVLLRTLGASERQVRIILLVEYAALGGLSACAGVLLSIAANYGLAKWVFHVPAAPSVMLLGTAFVIATAIAVAAGLALSRGVSRHPPLEILRGIG